MSTGPVQQFPIYAEDETGYSGADAPEPIENGEAVDATVFNRPINNLRLRTETVRGTLEDLLYLADADRALILAGPGKVTWPGSLTAGGSGIFVLSDVLYILPALTMGSEQTAPVPPVASFFGNLALTRMSDSATAIAVDSRLYDYQGGNKLNVSVVAGGAFACVLADETTMSVVITATGATTLTTVMNALNLLENANGDLICTAALDGGVLGSDIIEAPQGPTRQTLNHDGVGYAITPAQLAAFFAIGGNPLQEGDSVCIQFSTVVDTSPATAGGRRQSTPENSNTSVLAASLFNSRVSPDRLVNALPVCKVVDGRLCFISGQQVPGGATTYDLGLGFSATGFGAFVGNVATSGFGGTDNGGLSFTAATGLAWLSGQLRSVAAATLTLTDNTVNYVYVNASGVTVFTTVEATAFALTNLVLYKITTSGADITEILDTRRQAQRFNSRGFVTVGGAGGDFATLEGAVAWVNSSASVGDDRPFEILIQGDVAMTIGIVLDDVSNLAIRQRSDGHINTPSGSAAFFTTTGTSSNVTFDGVRFNVPTDVGSQLIGIGGNAVTVNWTIHRCVINGGEDAHTISVSGTGTHTGWKITHNEIYGMTHSSLYVSLLLTAFTDCIIEYNEFTGGTGDGFDVFLWLGYGANNVNIAHNKISTGAYGIFVTDDNFPSALDATTDLIRIRNNIFDQNLTYSIVVAVTGSVFIEDNVFQSTGASLAGANGVIHIDDDYDPEFVSIQRNKISWGGTGAAIAVLGTDGVFIIEHNWLFGNGDESPLAIHFDNSSPAGCPSVSFNYIDMNPGAGPAAGVASGIAINMGAAASPRLIGNTIRNCGTVADPGQPFSNIGSYAIISLNIIVNSRGTSSTSANGVMVGNDYINGLTQLLDTVQHNTEEYDVDAAQFALVTGTGVLSFTAGVTKWAMQANDVLVAHVHLPVGAVIDSITFYNDRGSNTFTLEAWNHNLGAGTAARIGDSMSVASGTTLVGTAVTSLPDATDGTIATGHVVNLYVKSTVANDGDFHGASISFTRPRV